jgi:membrane AbrB-like protein
MPRRLGYVMFELIGISLGAVVTPDTLSGMAAWPLSIAMMVVAIVAISVASTAYLQWVHGWGHTAAMLASAPGALSQVMVMAGELGVDIRAVAIVQTIRVLIVSASLPLALSQLGLITPGARSIGGDFNPDLLGELVILIVLSAILAALFLRFRIPGGLLFGAMLCSGVLHGSGLVHALMPWWVANAAMIALGAVTGSRFANTPVRLVFDFVAAAFGSFFVAAAIASVFAAFLIALMPALHPGAVLLSFAPGSVDAMMLLALALAFDPVYVGAHHLSRIFFVSVTLPLVTRRIAHKVKPPAPPPDASTRPESPFQD